MEKNDEYSSIKQTDLKFPENNELGMGAFGKVIEHP
jgi:hypothetical protein